ncbi:MAG: hypothetical protein QOG69_1178 [Actinomycetota bacterium]|jgi:membrane protein YdbS with pleckstrin-like domain|nr:hypothetical protein [Actinomycetota bacterium]
MTRPRLNSSRFASSAATFGLIGRVIGTVLCLWPIWLAIQFSVVTAIIVVPAYLFVLPLILRDLWKRGRREPNLDVAPGALETDQQAPPGQRIADRPSPRRW